MNGNKSSIFDDPKMKVFFVMLRRALLVFNDWVEKEYQLGSYKEQKEEPLKRVA